MLSNSFFFLQNRAV